MNSILFDMDGTLIDSAPGIKRCAQITLHQMKLPIIPYEELDFFIGPPLRDCFRLCSVPESRIEEAVSIYRSYYEKEGKLEGSVYPFLPKALNRLKQLSFKLYICTSKNETIAKDMAIHYHYDSLFDGIYGAKPDGSISTKKDIIGCCLKEKNIKNAIMVGDTYLDIQGANENQIQSIGVTWGYGDKQKMKDYKASLLVSNGEELVQAVLSLSK